MSPGTPTTVVTEWVEALRLATGYPIVTPRQHSVPLQRSVASMGWTTSTPIPQADRGPEITARQVRTARHVRALIEARRPLETPVSTALDRLGRAIEQPIQWPQGLLFAVMGLEALFLEGQPEARRTLASRAAFLLGLVGDNSSTVQKDLRLAYDLRSQYVHGGEFDSQGAQQIVAMHRASRGYLRRAILLYLIHGVPKKQVLPELDDGMVNLHKATELRALLRTKMQSAGVLAIVP